jgi:hypothetical protein
VRGSIVLTPVKKTVLLAALVSMIVGPSIIGGSMVGATLSRPGLFAGAIVGGLAGIVIAVLTAVRLGLIATDARRRTAFGGVIGFGIASALVILDLYKGVAPGIEMPLIPMLSGMLVPLGTVIGSRSGSTRRSASTPTPDP